MTDIVVLVPMLGRGERAGRFMESILEASAEQHRVLFLCSRSDQDTWRACMATGAEAALVPFDLGPGDYARKINYGIGATREAWVFQCAIDVQFHRGWDEAALAAGAQPHVGVVGTNDLGNPLVRAGRHATHSLIRRAYVQQHGTIDEPGKALHEGYHHCWVDNELVETAVSRRAWVSARRSRVEHLHYIWHKGSDDDTYRRGMSRFHADRRLFESRRPLWRGTKAVL